MTDFRLMVAPLQGFTEAVFRHYHASMFGGDGITYLTPFLRYEKGEVRRRDLRDITSPLNDNHRPIPQIIARGGKEFGILAEAISAAGYSRADINLGCPFTPQVKKGRGAGLLADNAALTETLRATRDFPGMQFYIKMRLGTDHPDQWRQAADIINDTPLTHVAVHPRTATEQYSGPLHYDEFDLLVKTITHPVIYNGEIASPDDIDNLRERFPDISGVMAGRGILRRPSLFSEWLSGTKADMETQRDHILRLHAMIYGHCRENLCGAAQILSKIKPMWEYFGATFDRKRVKRIMKSTTTEAYEEAVGSLNI